MNKCLMKGNGNPWIGLSSYDESMVIENEYKFCGRKNAVQKLFSLVDNNLLTTLYGKSGVGKTSILQAGLFPKLRLNGYVPYVIRLGVEGSDLPYAQIITNAISTQNNCSDSNIDDANNESYLQRFFSKSELFSEYGEPVYPVIVLDQFEELFFKDIKRLEILLKQMYALIDDSSFQQYGDSRYVTNYRFVISLREDDFFRLEDIIDRLRLNEMKYNRYRLIGLSAEEAKEVISVPSEGHFLNSEIVDISELLVRSAKDDNGEINTAMLSLTCNRLYEKAYSESMFPITKGYVEQFLSNTGADFLEQFYNEIKVRLSIPSRWYFLEDELLTSSGRRRTITESELRSNIPDVDFLFHGQHALLRFVTLETQKERMVELLHDTLAKAMMSSRAKRIQQELIQRQKRNNFIKMTVLGVALCLCGLFAFLCLKMSIMHNSLTITQSRYLVSEAISLKNEGNVAKAIRLLLYALPGDRSNSSNEINRPDVPEARYALYEMVWKGDDNVAFRHRTTVMDAVFSHDGKYVATTAYNNEIRIWNAVTGAAVSNLISNSTPVCKMSFSPDDNAFFYVLRNGTICKLDLKTEDFKEIVKLESLYVDDAVFNNMGSRVAALSSAGDIRVWDIIQEKEISTELKNREVASFDIDGVGERIAMAEGEKISIYFLNSHDVVELPLQCAASDIYFSPDGRYLMLVSERSDELVVWDINASKVVFKKQKGFRSVVWSQDSKLIATVSSEKDFEVWDVQKSAVVGHKKDFTASKILLSPDGERLLAVNILAKITPLLLDSDKPYSMKVNDICSCPDTAKNYIATIENELVRIWNFKNDVQICSLKHPRFVIYAEFSRDGKYIVTVSADEAVHVWNINEGKEAFPPLYHPKRVITASFDYDSKRIVTTSRDSLVRVWDVENGKQLISPILHPAMLISASFAPDGTKIITTSQDSCARIWRVRDRQHISTLKHDGKIGRTVKFTKDGMSVLTTSSDRAILWDVSTATHRLSTMKHNKNVETAAFSPDYKYIITSSIDGTVRIWDSCNGLPVTSPIHHKYPVRNALFCPDGSCFATLTADNTISLGIFLTIDEILSRYHDDKENRWALTEEEMREYCLVK